MSPRLRSRELTFLVGAVAIIALAVIFLLVFLPQLGNVRAARREAGAKAQELARNAAVLDQRTEIERRHREAAALHARTSIRIPSQPAMPELLSGLEGALHLSGVSLLKLSLAPPPAPATEGQTADSMPVASVSFQMQVYGTYLQIRTLVGTLETIPRAVAVDRLALTGDGGGIVADFTLRAFYAR